MNWDLIFTIANNYALVMWLILAFAPRNYWRGDIVMKGLFYGGVAMLSLTYAVIVIPLLTGMIDGGSGATGGPPDFSSLAGVKALLSADGGATIGWIHYLAFDLFVGMWIARNADKYGFARWIQVPILFFTLMLGPLGLILYLLLRFARHNKVADSVVPQ